MVNLSGAVAARLRAWGVARVYGVPGLDVDPLAGALRAADSAPRACTKHGARGPPRDEADVRRAAEVLDGAGKPAVVVGNAGRAASGPAVGVASLLGAGVATTALARDALPDDLSYGTGVAGPLGSEAAAALLRECDTLLLVGAEDLAPALLRSAAICTGWPACPRWCPASRTTAT
ncbi:hypothetical protein [Streptomyces puniciscabiei]|uniref:hypothetical protein n=1 Tax=Streptomyces puniciscabiei TaxID=164348 RepID=UPI0037AA1E3C